MITRYDRDVMENNLKYKDKDDKIKMTSCTWSATASHQQLPSLSVGLRIIRGNPLASICSNNGSVSMMGP